MKTALALLLFLVPASQAFAAEPESKAGKDVLATVDTWKQAMLKGDAATLGKIYHDDLTYEHSSGKIEAKAEAIENATKAGAVAKSIEFHNPVVHVYGNAATVKSAGEFTSATGAVSHLDVLMVFIKTPHGWQMVARQATKQP